MHTVWRTLSMHSFQTDVEWQVIIKSVPFDSPSSAGSIATKTYPSLHTKSRIIILSPLLHCTHTCPRSTHLIIQVRANESGDFGGQIEPWEFRICPWDILHLCQKKRASRKYQGGWELMRDFDERLERAIWKWLNRVSTSGASPLRHQLERVGWSWVIPLLFFPNGFGWV